MPPSISSPPLGIQALFGDTVGPYRRGPAGRPGAVRVRLSRPRLLISRVTGTRTAALEGEGHYAQLILTLGIALILQNGGLILFGSMLASIRTPLSSSRLGDRSALRRHRQRLRQQGARHRRARSRSLIVIVLSLLITRSRLGKSLRAAADNPEAATYMGIDVDRAHRIAFALGSGITAIAGGLLATNYPFQPYVGLEYVIVMYAGVVLGGMGSIIGAFWGGMTIGLVQQLSTLVLPTQLQNTAIFVVFLLIVFFRPQGFFGRMVERTLTMLRDAAQLLAAPALRRSLYAGDLRSCVTNSYYQLMLTLVPVWAVFGLSWNSAQRLHRAWSRSATRPSSASAPTRPRSGRSISTSRPGC